MSQVMTELGEDKQLPRVLLMGAAGSGKSTFISSIAGKDVGIGHELESKTNQIEEFEVQHGGRSVVLVEIPGFDYKEAHDASIIKQVDEWLEKRSLKGGPVAGVIYLQMFSDYRLKWNSQMLQDLCGMDYVPRIALAFTHLAERGTRRYNEDFNRHVEFREKWCTQLVGKGAMAFLMEASSASSIFALNPGPAKEVLDHVLNVPGVQCKIGLKSGSLGERREVWNSSKDFIEIEVLESITSRLKQIREEKKLLRQDLEKGKDTTATKAKLDVLGLDARSLKLRRARLTGDIIGILRYNGWRL